MKYFTLPENFTGSISNTGLIEIQTDKRSSDIFFGGKLVVGEIMARHFKRDSIKLKIMKANKRELLIMIRDFRNNLNSEQQP